MQNIFQKITSYFIPENQKNVKDFDKASGSIIFVQVSIIVFIISFLYSIVAFLIGYKGGLVAIMPLVFISLLCLFLYKTAFPLHIIQIFFYGVCFSSIAITVYNTSGFDSFLISWLTSVPVGVVLINGRKAGFIALLVSFIIITIFYFLSLQNYPFPNGLKTSYQKIYSLFSYFGLIGMLYIVAIFFYNAHTNAIKQEILLLKANEQLLESRYKNQISEISFMALQSQMNPHFIFNCLNSIKLYTEQNNNELASDYLSKFSKLIRHTLSNVRSERVSLVSEINSIELYLQLEMMRFKEKLSYSINVADDVDEEFIEIPPMLVQPFIENSIWHGLMHKASGGKIEVDFAPINDNQSLQITIKDNGIGRKAAAALKSKNTEANKSFGIKISSERISLINEKYQSEAHVEIKDLFDDENNPAGTLVTITIPIK